MPMDPSSPLFERSALDALRVDAITLPPQIRQNAGRPGTGIQKSAIGPDRKDQHALLGRTARPQCSGKRAVVEHIQSAANGYALGDTRHRHIQWFEAIGKPMRRSGTVHRAPSARITSMTSS